MYGKPPQSNKFKPGQSGNPNGRPKKLNDQDMLKTLQQIIKLYADAKSNDKTLRKSAKKILIDIKEILLNRLII